MLGKLIKYEFSATRRLILPLFLVVLAMSVINRIVISIDAFDGALRLIPGSIMALYIISVVVALLITAFYLIARFYKNYMTDEGYLMFTIPANSHQLTLSKLITSTVWTIAIILVMLISIAIVVYTPDRMTNFMNGLKDVMSQLQIIFGKSQTSIIIIELVLAIFSASIYATLMIYFAISLGQLFNGHKIIGSFGAYMGLYTITQILSTIALVIIGNVFVTDLTSINLLYTFILPTSIIISLIMSAIYYVGIQYILNHKLNLE